MSDLTCKTCGEHFVTIARRCPPLFLALDPECSGDLDCSSPDWSEAYHIYAYDAESAARKAAKKMDDSWGEGGHERDILIKDTNGKTTKWAITFDYSVDYYAKEMKV